MLLNSLARATEPVEHNERLAFWINAYNIMAIKVVLSKYPVDDERSMFEVHDAAGNAVPAAFSSWFQFRAAHPTAAAFGSENGAAPSCPHQQGEARMEQTNACLQPSPLPSPSRDSPRDHKGLRAPGL
ncbi:MAG: hypothetical protein PWP23_1089 [Candidatus Sumerlaeota bacterium]|nr:hypothetical protein [Candidatus Sumerlaeota bacterium]